VHTIARVERRAVWRGIGSARRVAERAICTGFFAELQLHLLTASHGPLAELFITCRRRSPRRT
jgi:hypothetical protein